MRMLLWLLLGITATYTASGLYLLLLWYWRDRRKTISSSSSKTLSEILGIDESTYLALQARYKSDPESMWSDAWNDLLSAQELLVFRECFDGAEYARFCRDKMRELLRRIEVKLG